MRFTTQARPLLKSLEDVFYCRGKRRSVQLATCLDGYVNATSLENRRSACFHCPSGRQNREGYASPIDREEVS